MGFVTCRTRSLGGVDDNHFHVRVTFHVPRINPKREDPTLRDLPSVLRPVNR